MHSLFSVVIVFVVVMAVANALLDAKGGRKSSGGRRGRVHAKPLMTDREVKFCRLLRDVAAPLHVAPQVAMGALLSVSSSDRSSWRATRNSFDRKIVDFVLLDDDGRVELIVELDDRTHLRDRDADRDRLTAQAGYQTLRVNGVTARDRAMLRTAVDNALGRAVTWQPPAGECGAALRRAKPAAAPRRERNTSAPPNTRRA